jgi:predicted AAA+ superfamily ATPase
LYPRFIGERLTHLSRFFPAVVLTGARQTGKTTVLRSVFPKHHYVTLDLPSASERAEQDPSGFLASHPPPVLVDEVQYAPALFRHIKSLIDADRHQPGQWILTGSQRFPLMKEVAESLAGRAAIVHLEGLSWSELAQRPPFGQ